MTEALTEVSTNIPQVGAQLATYDINLSLDVNVEL